MAVTSPPIMTQGGSHSALAFRQAFAAVLGAPVQTFAGGVSPTTGGGAHGVVGDDDLKVVQRAAGANLSVDVSAGYAMVAGSSVLAQGSYSFANDAVVNVGLTAADGTNPRIDLVVAQVREHLSDASGFNDARLLAVTGTPAAVPVVPAVPAGCLVLAEVLVGAGVTSVTNANITDRRSWLCAIGGVQRCLSTLRPTGAARRKGLSVSEVDTGRRLEWDGTGWVVMSEPVTAYTPTTANVSFGGGGAIAGQFQRSNGWCDVYLAVALGTSSAGSFTAAGPRFGLPAAAAANPSTDLSVIGSCVFYDADGGLRRYEPLFIAAYGQVEPRINSASALTQITNTSPVTVAVNDRLIFMLRYQLASRYA